MVEQKILYHFAIFVIVNELLIIKDRRINPTYNHTSAQRDAAV